jgi:hypothetical protein
MEGEGDDKNNVEYLETEMKPPRMKDITIFTNLLVITWLAWYLCPLNFVCKLGPQYF